MAKRMTARQREKEEAAGRRASAPKPQAAAPKTLPTSTADAEGDRKAAEKQKRVAEVQQGIEKPLKQSTVARRSRLASEVTRKMTPEALATVAGRAGLSGYAGLGVAATTISKGVVARRKRSAAISAESAAKAKREAAASAPSTLKALGEKPSQEETEEMTGQMAEILARGTLRGKSASGVSKERAIRGVERVYKGSDYVPNPDDPEDFTQVTELDVRGPDFKNEKEIAEFKDAERAHKGVQAMMSGTQEGTFNRTASARSPGLGGPSGRQPRVKKGYVAPRPTHTPSGEPLYPAAPFPNAATAVRTTVDLNMGGTVTGSEEWRRARGYHFAKGRVAQAASGERPFATPLRQQVVEQGLARIRGELFPPRNTPVSTQVVGTNSSPAQPAKPVEEKPATNARQRRLMRRNTSGL